MFLLFLIGLGTASLNAQVRIGGNAAPNASAVLDLNADDTNSGTKGLALPRVALTSNQMLLPGVTQNLTGMMVYNTSTTGTGVNRIGIYYWNGATWVLASLPSTSAADSGKFLVSNGVSWILGTDSLASAGPAATITSLATPIAVNWTLWINSNIVLNLRPGTFASFTYTDSNPLNISGFCVAGVMDVHAELGSGLIRLRQINRGGTGIYTNYNTTLRCYRPST